MSDGKDPYTPEQVAACENLIREILKQVPSIKWLTTHRQISFPRKTDPYLFDARAMATRLGLTYWTRTGVPGPY
jgi:N-acetyl-anhydromuramyl-L-alanine amidase AmpD